MNRSPRVAIVSDPLVQRGGAERFVEHLARLFPEAPVFAILYSEQTGPASLADRIVPSFLQRIPGAVRRHRLFLPLYPAAIESFDLSAYDVILSSHHTAAKGVLRNAQQRHICYCHTPMRALWERPFEELAALPAIARPFAAHLMHGLRQWDAVAAQRVDHFMANSELTRTRIRKHYGREASVVYSPCTLDLFTPGDDPVEDYFLVAGRDVPYKRIDLAVEATRLAGARLVITGCKAKKYEAPHVKQLGVVDNETLVRTMRQAKALIFPAYEDFGMTPVEMMACGRPVIAYGSGGALETVVDGRTGVHVSEQTARAFAAGIARFETLTFDPVVVRRNAERFSMESFSKKMYDAVYGPLGLQEMSAAGLFERREDLAVDTAGLGR